MYASTTITVIYKFMFINASHQIRALAGSSTPSMKNEPRVKNDRSKAINCAEFLLYTQSLHSSQSTHYHKVVWGANTTIYMVALGSIKFFFCWTGGNGCQGGQCKPNSEYQIYKNTAKTHLPVNWRKFVRSIEWRRDFCGHKATGETSEGGCRRK